MPKLTAKQQEVVLRLAADFLKEFSDRLGNDGCNDWEWPVYVTDDVKKVLVDADWRNDFGDESPPNWAAVDWVAAALAAFGKEGE